MAQVEPEGNDPDDVDNSANDLGLVRKIVYYYNTKDITLDLKLPPIKSHQQVFLKAKVVTDRCFLLLNDVNVNVKKCGTASSDENLSKIGCENLFRFISPKSEEYYSEFKEISPNELLAQEEGINNAKKMEVLDLYNAMGSKKLRSNYLNNLLYLLYIVLVCYCNHKMQNLLYL